jgi:hypothetical protein
MRFLRELRQLRNEAGLEPAELAARAHYPRDIIVAAEAGPSIPGLPVLSAYVRGCGAGLAEWEERWRFLTGSPAATPCLPARPAGCSSLADAGARLGAAVSSNPEGLIPAQVMQRLSALAEPALAESILAESVLAETAPAEPTPAETASVETAPAEAVPAEAIPARTTPPAAAAGAVPRSGPLPAVRPGALAATRQARFPCAVLAAIVAGVMAVLGTIFVLLRRKG